MTNPVSSIDALPQYWYSIAPLTLTATASDALCGLNNVAFYYEYSADNVTWTGASSLFGSDSTAPYSASFNWPAGNGYYQFFSVAYDKAGNAESTGGVIDAIAGYDTSAPSSSVTFAGPYWCTASPLTVTATASDSPAGNVANVELFARSSMDNSTWGSWTSYGVDNTAPWSWSYNFGADIYYQFYTRATDTLGNIEGAPAFADSMWAYDITAPGSSATQEGNNVKFPPNWQINATASDDSGSLACVQLWYRHAPDNATWSAYISLGNDTAAPWQWAFTSPDGAGYYEFYTIAIDSAGNTEAAPAAADARWRYLGDSTPPVSTVDGIVGFWRASSPYTVTATAADTQSGVANVTLWFSSSTNNATWTAWLPYETDTTSPWIWSFNFPNGSAYYRFYTIACDNASNEEAAPTTADTICVYDAEIPTIQDTSALTATTGEPFTVTAIVLDNMAIDHVYLIYWFGTGTEINITISGNPRTYIVPVLTNILNVLHYRIAAVDFAGNWNITATRNVPVSDNDQPVANAGAYQTVDAGTQITFNGTGSTDNIGIINYTWTFTHNGTGVTLYGATPVFIFWENVNHTVTLQVRDGAGNSGTDTVNILVLQLTLFPPVADAGTDATITSGHQIILDGSGSTDDVGITNYTWTFSYNDTTITLYGIAPQFTFWTVGDFTVTLTVSDADGLTDTDTVLIRVNSETPEDNEGGLSEYYWILFIFIGAIATLLILILLKRQKKDKNTDETDEDEDGQSEDVHIKEEMELAVEKVEAPKKTQ
jgi:hypothetical protein